MFLAQLPLLSFPLNLAFCVLCSSFVSIFPFFLWVLSNIISLLSSLMHFVRSLCLSTCLNKQRTVTVYELEITWKCLIFSRPVFLPQVIFIRPTCSNISTTYRTKFDNWTRSANFSMIFARFQIFWLTFKWSLWAYSRIQTSPNELFTMKNPNCRRLWPNSMHIPLLNYISGYASGDHWMEITYLPPAVSYWHLLLFVLYSL